eukprot:688508-Amorphochlora_amoeboformis.AAC.1
MVLQPHSRIQRSQAYPTMHSGILATEYRDLGYWNLESQLDRLTLEVNVRQDASCERWREG